MPKKTTDYDLLSFPSPVALAAGPDDGPGGHGISLRRVDGRYYGADLREEHPEVVPNINPVEADEIVAEVLRRFEASPQALPSIGVVTFNMPTPPRPSPRPVLLIHKSLKKLLLFH